MEGDVQVPREEHSQQRLVPNPPGAPQKLIPSRSVADLGSSFWLVHFLAAYTDRLATLHAPAERQN